MGLDAAADIIDRGFRDNSRRPPPYSGLPPQQVRNAFVADQSYVHAGTSHAGTGEPSPPPLFPGAEPARPESLTETPSLTDTPGRIQELTAVLAQMGAVVLSAESIDTTVELVATLAAATIPHTTGAGVTLVDAHGVNAAGPRLTPWSKPRTPCSTRSTPGRV